MLSLSYCHNPSLQIASAATVISHVKRLRQKLRTDDEPRRIHDHLTEILGHLPAESRDRMERLLTEFHLSQMSNEEVEAILSGLPVLPPACNEILQRLLRPASEEIIRWVRRHESFLNVQENSVPFLKHFPWTPLGVLDQKAAAELLLDQQQLKLGLMNSFILASIYCLESRLPKLWQQYKSSWYNFRSDMKRSECPLAIYWSHVLDGESEALFALVRRNSKTQYKSIQHYALQKAVESHNVVATEWFCSKLAKELDPDELMSVLPQCAIQGLIAIMEDYAAYQSHNVLRQRHHSRFDFEWQLGGRVFRLLMSWMTEEMRRETLKKALLHRNVSPDFIPRCFLRWPMQNHFLATVSCMWTILPVNKCRQELFVEVLEKVVSDKSYDFHNLFKQLWQRTPRNHQQHLLNNEGNDFVQCIVLNKRLHFDRIKDYVETVLKNVNAELKMRIISRMHRPCRLLLFKNKWEILQLLLDVCLPSEEEQREFKRELVLSERSIEPIGFCTLIRSNDWTMVERVLQWSSLSEDEILVLKQNVNEHGFLCANLVADDKWEHLRRLLEWSLTSEEEAKQMVKTNEDTWGFMLEFENCSTKIERVMKWCFDDVDEFLTFRDLLTSGTWYHVEGMKETFEPIMIKVLARLKASQCDSLCAVV